MTRIPMPNPAHLRPRRYTAEQICALFEVSEGTVRRWKRQGIIKPVRSDAYRDEYDATEIDALRAARTMRRQP